MLGACGAVCTAAAHVALTPLELVKTKLQTSAATSAVDVTKEIYEDDGLLALFAGWEPIIVGYFINGFFAFGLTEFLKRIVAAQLASDQAWAATVVGGSLGAAVVAVAVVTPFEAAKVRIQTLKANPSLLDTWSVLIKERGGWYDGLFGRSLGALIAKDVVFAAFKFAVFDAVRGAILQAYPPAANDALFVSIIAGAVAGACGAVASQPLDTTFARVETAKKGQDTGVFATFRRVVDEEGFDALVRGPRAAHVLRGGVIGHRVRHLRGVEGRVPRVARRLRVCSALAGDGRAGAVGRARVAGFGGAGRGAGDSPTTFGRI